MLLRPIQPVPIEKVSSFAPVWPVIESSQRSGAGGWLITQPDHAALAGDLAAQMGRPALDAEVVEAIGLHDEGWGPFDEKELGSAAPRSFLMMKPGSSWKRGGRRSSGRSRRARRAGSW